MKKLLLIFGLFTVVAAFANNPCLSFQSISYENEGQYFPFQGNDGTLSQLGGLILWIEPDSNNPTVLKGSISYYNEAFGASIAGTCIDNKNDTAAISLTADNNMGWVKGIFYVTPAGPIFHITSTYLLNQNNKYSNVTGNLTLSLWTGKSKLNSK